MWKSIINENIQQQDFVKINQDGYQDMLNIRTDQNLNNLERYFSEYKNNKFFSL